MAIFKITNITNTLSKRESKYNTDVEFNIGNGIKYEKIIIKPGQLSFVECRQIPISVYKLKLNGLILIEDSNHNEYNQLTYKPKSKIVINEIKSSNEINELNKELLQTNMIEIQQITDETQYDINMNQDIENEIQTKKEDEPTKQTKRYIKKDKEIE